MKVVEILKLSRNFLEVLHKSCIKVEDCKFIELFEEYTRMMECGAKSSYVVAVLAEKYKICERKVYYIIKRLGKDCKFCADE
jgi:hypothetical protein